MNSARGSIHLEDAPILEHRAFAGNQHIIRVAAPAAAARATPGSFAHLACDPSVPMRRPLSIMRADAAGGWLEFLYKPVGVGLAKLAQRKVGERLSVLAPIGNGFALDAGRPRVLAIGGGVGIPPMVFLAEVLRQDKRFELVVLMGSELPFPFSLVGSKLDVGVAAPGATHGLELLEQWRVPSRLASNAGIPGAYAGYVTELARNVLAAQSQKALSATQIVACGPEPMLRAAAKLARSVSLPCHVALEEFMACGLGGCAGCTVLVRTPDGDAMKKVCVDGPVFDAATVYGLMSDRG
jgi:dihydroorotate dehydrogenase electron transfer subunit